MRQPGSGRQSDGCQDVVQKSVSGIHEPEPNNARRNRTGDTGQIEQNPEKFHAADLAVDEGRKYKSKNDIERNCHQRVQQNISDGAPKQ